MKLAPTPPRFPRCVSPESCSNQPVCKSLCGSDSSRPAVGCTLFSSLPSQSVCCTATCSLLLPRLSPALPPTAHLQPPVSFRGSADWHQNPVEYKTQPAPPTGPTPHSHPVTPAPTGLPFYEGSEQASPHFQTSGATMGSGCGSGGA